MTIYMAPIKGITDMVFRRVYDKHFNHINFYMAPFIVANNSVKVNKNHFKQILPQNNPHLKLIPQILSNNSEAFIFMAKILFDMGYTTINWNLGCPHPTVTKKNRGSALLQYPDKIDSFLNEVIPNIPNKISIKMRLGYEYNDDFIKIIPVLNQYSLKDVTIHPRTAKQMYNGKVNIEKTEIFVTEIKHKIMYSGDIFTREDYNILKEKFPSIDMWMIGRGLLENPYLPEEIKKNSNLKRNYIKLKKFHDQLIREYCELLSGPKHPLDKMKGFWFFYKNLFKIHSEDFKSIQNAKTIQTYKDKVNLLFQKFT